MKNYITYFILSGTLLLGGACNDEWKDEIYRQDIGLKAVINSEGVTNIYLPYEPNGETVYQLPVIVGGSKMSESDLDIHIAVDKDTLNDLNEARWKRRTDLYYEELPQQNYEFVSPTCHIPAGTAVGLYDIKFKFSGLNLTDKWILPLTIVDDPSYNPNPRKNYRKALLRIMPYNDYSGSYAATNMYVYIEDNTSPTIAETRTLYVVSENQCFFYAGVISEELPDREKYKIILTFNEDGTIYAKAADTDNKMEFELIGQPTYRTSVMADATIPYIEHHYTIIDMEYTYKDVTTYDDYKISYKAKGSMAMERKLDTLKPERDQIQW
ncbi:DUF4973 domain-containing protein [Bacteroides zhangwenhongii]|uniref:DUF4973 domain-containing protein n=1 Tax=Bacteroides zhangwenhongii TaxID=2650157 RepID=UPI0022E5D9A5|nr:DUF4973 domain-containing protein [Bacteroides zhangwenhongii]